MLLTLTAVCAVGLCLSSVIWIKRVRDQRELELHSITPEALHILFTSKRGNQRNQPAAFFAAERAVVLGGRGALRVVGGSSGAAISLTVRVGGKYHARGLLIHSPNML